MKTCSKCGIDKEESFFSKEAKRKDGLYPWCKECSSHHRRMRYSKVDRKVWITQKVCSKCKEWRPREEFKIYPGKTLHCRCISCEEKENELSLQGLTECSSCGIPKKQEDFYASRLKKTSKQCISCQKEYHKNYDVKLRRRDANLKQYFGISLEQYKTLLNQQGYKCPICLKDFEKDKYSYPVDHAHNGPHEGRIRAILHDRCNRFVMAHHTDPEELRRAADLMESPLTSWFVPEEFIKTRKKRRPRKKKVVNTISD